MIAGNFEGCEDEIDFFVVVVVDLNEDVDIG